MYSKKLNLVFIYNKKAAGTTVCKSMVELDPDATSQWGTAFWILDSMTS